MTRALTHFFGSTDGYRTLARAPGVTDAEDAALASLGFGSPRTQADFDALDSQPCMAGRVLPSGRFAITRVFPGEPDVAGRQTVERRTLIVDAKGWADLLACDLAATLAQAGTWRRERFAAGEAIEVEPLPGEDLLPEPGDDERRVFDALLEAHGTGRCATLPNDARWCRALLRLGGFLPAERTIGFGWGVGLWAVPQGVWLATLRPDAQPRNNFPARLGGAFMHLEEVTQLGRGEAAKQIRTSRKRKGERTRRMPPPWVIGAALALVLIVLTAWLVFAVRRKPEQAPVGQIVDTANVPPTAPNDSNAKAMPQASQAIEPTPATPPTAPVASAEPQPAPPPAETAPPRPAAAATTDAASQPGGFGSAASTREFGNGTGANAEVAVQATTPASPPPSGAPASTGTTPSTPVAIPPVAERTPASTPWDAEVKLLQESIDLSARVRDAAAKGAPDLDATLRDAQDLVALASKIRAEALKVDADLPSSLPRGADHRIFFVDAFQSGRPRSEYGPSKSFIEFVAMTTFPPAAARQIALLLARFEIARAAQALLQCPLGSAESVRKTLKDEEAAKGWPSTRPFEQWFFRTAGSAVQADPGEVFMADEFAKRLAGLEGMSSLVKQLRRIAPPPPPKTAPAPSAPTPTP